MTVYIDKDYIDDAVAGQTLYERPQYAIERLIGESPELPETGALIPFRLYDDDGELYYAGRLHDDDDCVNQLGALRWGETVAGCAHIKVQRGNEWVEEVG